MTSFYRLNSSEPHYHLSVTNATIEQPLHSYIAFIYLKSLPGLRIIMKALKYQPLLQHLPEDLKEND